MRIYADISAVQDRYSAERGVPKYTLEFAHAAARLEPNLVEQWLLHRGEPTPPTLLDLMSQARVGYREDQEIRPEMVHHLAPFQRVGSGITQHDLLDRRDSGTRVVATVYDMIPMIYPEKYFTNQVFRDDYLLACSFLQRADLILAISDSAARDCVDLLKINPRKVVAVGTGVPDSFEPTTERAATLAQLTREFPKLRPGFLLYVGGVDFRKNMRGLLEGYALVDKQTRRAHPLVVVCRLVGNSGRELRRTIRQLGISADVLLTDVVDDQTLLHMYQTTDLFLFPSLYEGFGLPVVEALRSGAPVLVGDNSSLRDIVTIPEARFDASDPASIAAAVIATLYDEDTRTRTLRDVDHQRHNWEAVVTNTEAAYRRLARPHLTPAGRRRIAFVTPLPPSATGIAIYNERLIGEVAKLVDVDVFSQPEATKLDIPGVRQFAYGAYGSLQLDENYKDTVFAIGNSFYHLNEFELLRRYGGTVMLHDVRISGLINQVLRLRPDLLEPAEIATTEQLAWREMPAHLGPYPSYEFEDQVKANALMSHSVTGWADRVLVHSQAGATVARLEAPAHEHRQIHQIPLAFSRPMAQRRRGADAITSFGYVNETKQAKLLCEAFVLAAPRLPEAIFAFVGHLGDPGLRAHFNNMIDAAGLTDRIIITDWQSESQYAQWIERSMLTIQPRVTFNGEASAAVAESLGAGIPTIVSDLGWMAELPDDVVTKIAVDITAQHLADLIVSLAADSSVLANFSRSARAYADGHGFDEVARQLVGLLGSET